MRKAVKDEAYVHYSRVMFLGAAGVGKTSLRRSLMRQPWQSGATSTVVADLHVVRPSQWMEGGQQQWQQVTHDDEINEIAKLLAIVSMSDKEAEEFIKVSSNVAAKPFSTVKTGNYSGFHLIGLWLIEISGNGIVVNSELL